MTDISINDLIQKCNSIGIRVTAISAKRAVDETDSVAIDGTYTPVEQPKHYSQTVQQAAEYIQLILDEGYDEAALIGALRFAYETVKSTKK